MDISKFCKPISESSPCGPNLEDSQEFLELDSVAHPRSRDQFSVSPDPDWPAVRSLAQDYLGKSIDIRVLVELGKALVKLEGAFGVRQTIGLLRCVIETFWADVHPQLQDEDGDWDPQIRLNALAEFGNKDGFLRLVREAPLVRSRALGIFSFRDIQLASGQLKLPEGSDAVIPDLKIIEAAFQECDADGLQGILTDLGQAVADMKAIRNFLASNFSEGSPNFGELPESLDRMSRLVSEFAANRGLAGAVAEARAAGGQSANERTEMPEQGRAFGGGAGVPMRQTVPGEINNRSDVEAALDRIVGYYRDHEPSSPVPLLLLRAKRMVTMDFMSIMRDIADDGVNQARMALGVKDD